MKPGWMTTLTLATAAAACATVPVCKPTLLLTLEDGQLAGALLLGMAEGTTARIFAQLGIRTVWQSGGGPSLLPCAVAVRIVLESDAPARFGANTLGYATVGGRGAAIHIFLKRVIQSHTRELAPVLLGHVFAHEITHYLENTARHSEAGVLKAHWDAGDFDEMAAHPLPFAPEDAELVRARFAL